MLQNYLKVAWRNLSRHKLYAIINITGLAIGTACFVLIFLFVRHELSFDGFYEDADQIYRVYQGDSGKSFMGKDYSARTPAGLASVLPKEFPEVVDATSVETQKGLLGFGKNYHFEEGLLADPSFFAVFPQPFLSGSAEEALQSPTGIVLTRSLAEKIFGDEDAMGQALDYSDGKSYTVSGVVADPPANSSLQYAFVRSILSWPDYIRDKNFAERWGSNSAYTFLRLAEETNSEVLEDKLPALLEKYIGEQEATAFPINYFIQPLRELHLEHKASEDIGRKGNPQYISLFSFIAILVLILACINYTNLAVARMMDRVGEVGLRKTIGATRRQIAGQFLGESLLNAVFALVLGLSLVHYTLPFFNRFLERKIELNLMTEPWLLPGLLLLVVAVGILAGSYPAFFLSSLRATAALKGKADRRLAGVGIQRWLIAGQYTASIVLLTGSLVIYCQFRYLQQKSLGYDREHIVAIPIPDNAIHEKIDLLKSDWAGHPGILATTVSSSLPTNVDASRRINYDYSVGGEQDGALSTYRVRVDEDYLKVFNIDLLAGRNFSFEQAAALENERIINETAARALGWSAQEAIGKQFDDIGAARTVIGVMRDIHMHSMHRKIEPLMLTANSQDLGFVSVKIRPENLQQSMAILKEGFEKHTAYPFEYQFLDEHFDGLYKSDLKMGEMFGIFTFLSILIASLGLFGLGALTARQRTKEIGIRKVLGASVGGIVQLLSADYLKIVLIGFGLAIPLGWYLMNLWLQNFAYHIDLQWWMFVLSGLVAIVMALFSVGLQSWMAALANPVGSLKNE